MATDYVLLYSGGRMPESDEEQATVMKAWEVWMQGLGPALKDGGNPFTPGASKTITADGAVRDGAGSASGYSILTADSLDAATEMAQGLSGAPGRCGDRGLRDLRGDVAIGGRDRRRFVAGASGYPTACRTSSVGVRGKEAA